MAAQLRTADPASALVRADGNALPFRSAQFDLVTYAQSWHWTDPARSVPEAMRVLRPGGTLAMWWNEPDPDVPWSAAQEARLAAALPGYYQFGLTDQAPELLRSYGHEPVVRMLRWVRTVVLETHLAHLGSHSFFASMGAEQARRALEHEGEALLEVFPDGRVAEQYAVRLITVRAPG